jgi:hypothetical protein
VQSFLSSIRSGIIVCVGLAIGFAGGCKDNPDRAAQKTAYTAVGAAMQEYASTGDFEKAQKTLKLALADSSGEAGGKDAVLLAEGIFNYCKATKIQKELSPLCDSTGVNLDKIAIINDQIGRMKLEKMEIEAVMRSRQEEVRQCGVQLEGDPNGPGLTAKLKDAQSKLAGLKSQQDEINQKLSEKLTQATEIQRQADELRSKAELVKGEEKAQLQKQAYDVLSGTSETAGKNSYLREAQELQDQLSTVESEISLAEPQAAMFTAQVDKIRKRVDELDKSDFAAQSNERLTAIGSTLARFQEEFTGVLGQIEQTQSSAAEKIKQTAELLSSVQKNFKRVTSDESLRDFARVAAAEATLCGGKASDDYALWLRQLAARLSIVASGDATDSQAQLKTLSQRYLDDSDEYVSKAITDYNDSSDLYGKIPARKSDEFSVAVLKNRILVLARKASLAQRVEKMDAKAAAVEEAKELIERAVDFDPAFAISFGAEPYSILTDGKIPVSAQQAAIPAEANAATAMAAPEANQPAEEPNQPVAEPNEAAAEPNEPAVEEPNQPKEEPNSMPLQAEPNA